ncbi:MAG: PKD domain-containing protein [Vicingaceae bacterium]
MKKLALIYCLLLFPAAIWAQCFQVLDGGGNFSDNPYFVSCTPGDYTIFVQVDQNIGPFVINWGDGSPNTTGATLLTTGNESHTYTATTDTFNITITDQGTGCVVNGVVVMERNPLASIQLPAGDDNFGCTPVQFRFINSTTQVSQTTTFVWDFGDGSPIETYDFTNAGDTITHTYLPGVGVQSCNLEVTLTATNYCGASTASFFPLRVWDLDEAQIDASATLLCYPDTIVQYTNNTIRNCFPEGNQSQRYEKWNFGDYWGQGQDSIIDWRPWNPPIINPPPIGYPGVGTYTVTLIDSSFCGLDTTTLDITITNPPTAVLSSNKDTICEGESVRFFNNSVGGANQFSWNFDRGQGWQNLNGNNKNRTFNNAGDYTIRLAVGVAGAQGCNDTASVELYVNPSPDTDFSFDTNNECDSMTVNFSDLSTGNIVSWNWDFGNGNTFSGQNPPAQDYNSPGTYTIKLVTTNNRACPDSTTKQIRVRETPSAGFTANNICLNTTATFIDTSSAALDPITSYKWYFGDGDSSTAQNPNHLYTAFGNYTVTQIVDNGFCQDTATLSVTVENNPTADFSVDTDEGCSRLTVNFTNQSSANAVNFQWNFGDGSSPVNARDTFHTFTNNSGADTSFVVRMIAQTAFGCADTVFDTIRVFPVPLPSFTSDAMLDCGPLEVNFTNTTQGDSLDFFWNFGDGSAVVNDTNPTHIYQNQSLFISNYDVSLVVVSNNGCRDTTTQQVTVYPEPIFTFSAVPDSGCSPLRVTFPSVVGAVDYRWDFGDGSIDSGATPTHVFVNNTTNDLTYTVQLIAQNSFGCQDTTYGSVLVYPNPTSNFSLDTNVGCQPLPINITNNSTGANSFRWDFGDGTTSDTSDATFVKTFTNNTPNAVFNTIELITETDQGCRDTTARQVEVHPFIAVDFSSDTVGCSPYSVAFSNQSVGAFSYDWSFGDGNVSTNTNPNNLFVNAGTSNQTYTTELIGTSVEGCADTASQNILIYPKPTADFVLDTNKGCQPLQLQVNNNSVIADSLIWTFGDGTTSDTTVANFIKTYTNTSQSAAFNTLRLIVLTDNGCRDTISEVVEVHPFISVDFTSDTAGCQPFPVQFNNQSIGASNYNWTFGDGANSTASNPNYTYRNNGTTNQTFTAQLIGSSTEGCADTATQDIVVFPKPTADYSLTDTAGCHPLPVTFTNSSVIADSCIWSYGEGTILRNCAPTNNFTYTNTTSFLPVNFNSRLIVLTNQGCRDTATQNIRVNPQIIADFNSDTAGCSPLRIDFQDASTGVDTYEWTFGDGGGSPQRSPGHFFINSGQQDTIFNTKLKVTSAYGCVDSSLQDITIFPKPVADFVIDVNDGCQPLEVNFTNQSVLDDSCSWIYGDGAMSNDCSPLTQHTYTNTLSLVPVNYQAQLVVVTNQGCADSLSRNIRVKPQVTAEFTADTIGCSPLDVTFRSQSFGAANFFWDFGNGRQGNGMITTNQYTNTGSIDSIYTVELVAQSLYQCDDTARQDITVHPTPIPDFEATPVFQVFPDATVNLTNNTNAGNWDFFWDFKDGDTSILRDPISHTYGTWGQYLINLRASSQFCSDDIEKLIEIDVPVPIADFGDSASGCEPLEVQFSNLSEYGNQFFWDFGDGRGSSTAENPSYTYFQEGDYTVTLRVLGFDGNKEDTEVKQNYIQVFNSPRAQFFANKETVYIPNDPLVLSNTSVDGDNFEWDFGDGNTSTERSPIHYYQEEGFFDIRLIANTAFGCSDTFFLPTAIEAELEGRIEVPNAFTPNPNGGSGGAVNPLASGANLNDIFYAKIQGAVKYELNIFNKWGELLFVSNDINVGWDGYYRDKLCQQDVYVWKIKAEFADGESVVKVGDLMLLR